MTKKCQEWSKMIHLSLSIYFLINEYRIHFLANISFLPFTLFTRQYRKTLINPTHLPHGKAHSLIYQNQNCISVKLKQKSHFLLFFLFVGFLRLFNENLNTAN